MMILESLDVIAMCCVHTFCPFGFPRCVATIIPTSSEAQQVLLFCRNRRVSAVPPPPLRPKRLTLCCESVSRLL